MAKKTAAELRDALAQAEALELAATEGLTAAQTYFENQLDGIVDGTPEQLIELQATFRNFVSAIKANWRYRGMPLMTEEQRVKAREATAKSKAKKAATLA